MAEKMPSFKNGGAYWFVDLTTPDTMYIFPVLTALTFWITVEVDIRKFVVVYFPKPAVMACYGLDTWIPSLCLILFCFFSFSWYLY